MLNARAGAHISHRRHHVIDGVFNAELNEFFQRELAEEGYAGIELRRTPQSVEIVIRASHSQSVVGEGGRRLRELTSLLEKRFRAQPGAITLYADRIQERGMSAIAQCESLRYKLLNGLAVRRAAYGVVRFAMEAGAKGVEVVVAGKLRGGRAKAMKFSDGFMIHSGQPASDYIDIAVRHVMLRQGVLGCKVKIMRDPASSGKAGQPGTTLPDQISITEPKAEIAITEPTVRVYREIQRKVEEEPEAQE
ncbi:ribosomal 40S subunit protein S3 [Starmerella bacillaris]|uniref:Small ribosomal subunit protein uS3 n=1 Tax=Starmerella bacillaris TaxID=1247836 RepID=A0AAV5RJW6_STABA|nr:ribosomal 40S subunit protein S3 [Starmerella bacillaris]